MYENIDERTEQSDQSQSSTSTNDPFPKIVNALIPDDDEEILIHARVNKLMSDLTNGPD